MSRNTRGDIEKTRVQVVFRLQFHATHIPKVGWNNLFISFIPSDSGKATAKTDKANVRNGACKWADPIYETAKLLQDPRTKQYAEKLYKLLVAMGTSRSSVLGEAAINLSDYADASGTIVVALPLHGSNSGSILHVTVKLLSSKTGFREFEQQKLLIDRGLPANSDHDSGKLSTLEKAIMPRADMGDAEVRFRLEPKESGFIQGYPRSTADVHGLSDDLERVSSSQSHRMKKGKSDHHSQLSGTSHWVHQWAPETSVDQEMGFVHEENDRLRGDLKAADLSIHELRKEIASLQMFADSLRVEAQKMNEQIAVEISIEQDLAKEVAMLKLECLRFKDDLEYVRNVEMNSDNAELRHPDAVTVTSETSSMEDDKATEEEVLKMLREVDEAKLGQENLVRKMDEMECYYKGVVQELEVNQRQLLDELQNLRHEHSSCIHNFSSINAQMEAMQEQKCMLNEHNKDLERRATNSEVALRRTKLNYSNTIDQLQKDLDLLSSQVVSMYETNETLIGKALSEAFQPFHQDSNVEQSMECHQCPPVLENRHEVKFGRLLEDVKNSVESSPEDLCMTLKEELSDLHLKNINLDIFSVTLRQVIRESSLNLSNENMTVSDPESRKLESLEYNYRNYKSKYEDCDAEKANLVSQMEQVATSERHLSSEISVLQEEMMTMKIKVSESEKLQKMVNHIEERLEKLLGIGKKRVNGLFPCSKDEKNIGCDNFLSIFMHLEECLQNYNDKILQLTEENKILLNDRNTARSCFASAEARVMCVKQKFERDVQDIFIRLNKSSGLVEKLQIDPEAVSNKLLVISEVKEKFTQMTRDLLSDFTFIGIALQHPALENGDRVDKVIKAFGNDDEMSFPRRMRSEQDIEILDLSCQLKERDDKMAQLYERNKTLKEKFTTSNIQLLETHGLLIAMDVVQTIAVNQYNECKTKRPFEIGEVKSLLRMCETEIEDLIISKEELELRVLVILATVDEMTAQIRSREKSPFASHETLRIAFIKEQHEAKLQEIRHQLSVSEKNGEEMVRKLQDALDDVENIKKREASQMKRNEELLLEIAELEMDLHLVLADNCEKNQLVNSSIECNNHKCKLQDGVELPREQPEDDTVSMNPQAAQEALVSSAIELSDLGNSRNDVEHNGNVLNDQLKPHVLLSNIERLQKELEQMTSENTILLRDEDLDDLVGEVSLRDQLPLEKVSKELENVSSLRNDSSRRGDGSISGLELADVSSLKKNPTVQFQSSVLERHSDEGAVFQRCRNMLETRERYFAMETELKEMHERYSQLSLDFAEVQGERQKLMLILKNARPSNKGL